MSEEELSSVPNRHQTALIVNPTQDAEKCSSLGTANFTLGKETQSLMSDTADGAGTGANGEENHLRMDKMLGNTGLDALCSVEDRRLTFGRPA